MSLTFEDVRDRLKNLDEITLLEVLNVSSEDIVERFADRIEERILDLEEELEEDEVDSAT